MASTLHPESEIAELEVKLGVSFNNRDLLRQALTHESFINEWGEVDPEDGLASYERLEYLGDAVLNYAVANALFERSDAATRRRTVDWQGVHRLQGFIWLGRLKNSILATTSCEARVRSHTVLTFAIRY